MVNNGSSFISGVAQVGNSLDHPEPSGKAVLHITEEQVRPKFGGGLGAVRTGIALFWAKLAIPCTVCRSRKAA